MAVKLLVSQVGNLGSIAGQQFPMQCLSVTENQQLLHHNLHHANIKALKHSINAFKIIELNDFRAILLGSYNPNMLQ